MLRSDASDMAALLHTYGVVVLALSKGRLSRTRPAPPDFGCRRGPYPGKWHLGLLSRGKEWFCRVTKVSENIGAVEAPER